MDLSHQRHGSVEVVTLSGKLDASAAPHVRDQLRELVENGCPQLVADLSGVPLVDSSGLSALVTVFKAARNAGGDLALCGMQATVRSIMELTRLHHVFHVFESAEEAVSNFGA